MNATLEPPLMQVFLHTMRLPEEERLPERASKAQEELDRVFGVLQQRLEGREYVAGQTFSMADLLLGSTLGWIEKIGFLRNFPGLAEYARRTNARPACQRANAD